ncbi:hypothetical protein SUGI_0893090 [Cryptomeria japonica]|nr:hypothetical protein SUGI_0893090 [Cryptomeria japonica]
MVNSSVVLASSLLEGSVASLVIVIRLKTFPGILDARNDAWKEISQQDVGRLNNINARRHQDAQAKRSIHEGLHDDEGFYNHYKKIKHIKD